MTELCEHLGLSPELAARWRELADPPAEAIAAEDNPAAPADLGPPRRDTG